MRRLESVGENNYTVEAPLVLDVSVDTECVIPSECSYWRYRQQIRKFQAECQAADCPSASRQCEGDVKPLTVGPARECGLSDREVRPDVVIEVGDNRQGFSPGLQSFRGTRNRPLGKAIHHPPDQQR